MSEVKVAKFQRKQFDHGIAIAQIIIITNETERKGHNTFSNF